MEGQHGMPPTPALRPDAALIRQQKQQRWDQVRKEMSLVGDRLGMRIDTGISETVVGLNVLNINTVASCEGHLDWGTGAPWVDVAASGVEELKQRQEEAFKKANATYMREGVSEEELDTVYGEAHSIRKELKKKHLAETRKVKNLLEEFYRDRQTTFDSRLTLMISPVNGSSRLESQGAGFQETEEPAVKSQKLHEYQEEMAAFTEFLKIQYFES